MDDLSGMSAERSRIPLDALISAGLAPHAMMDPPKLIRRRRFTRPTKTLRVAERAVMHPILARRPLRRYTANPYEQCRTEYPRVVCRCGAYWLVWTAPDA